MSTELSNGVIIPEEYSDDWYDEMSINLRKLNDVITAASDNATDIQRLDTDKANQSDLTALTSRVSQNETDIIALQTAVSGALKREIVQTLPTEDISTTTIYMIRNSESSGTNIYDEYMYINNLWELIGTSATDFSNYYTKNETDNLLSAKANQTDLTSLSGRVTQTETDITALQTAVSGALKREIVQTLPTQDISTTTIYMIRNTTTSGDNIYDEYMYINNLWELIGTSATDFSNYYTKTEIDTLLSYKATDSDVVHKSGNETISGNKTFSSNVNVYNSDATATTPNLYLRSSKIELSSQGNTSGGQDLTYLDKNNTTYAYVKGAVQSNGSVVKIRTIAKDSSDNSVINELQILANTNGNKAIFPSYSNETDLGVSSYKWKSVYATNYYYGANNVEFSDKFVTTDTAQTISETKTFTNTIKSKKEIELTGNRLAYILPEFSASYSGLSLCTYGSNGAVKIGSWKVDDNDNTKHVLDSSLGYLSVSTGSVNSVNLVYLTPKNASKAKLGDSVNKWHEINGVEPSSLSLPSGNLNDIIDISSYLTILDGSSVNTYIAPANGWISILMNNCSSIQGYITDLWGHQIFRPSVGSVRFFMPVLKNKTVNILVVGGTIGNARFIPCQGNI